jgi:hypothetical protein
MPRPMASVPQMNSHWRAAGGASRHYLEQGPLCAGAFPGHSSKQWRPVALAFVSREPLQFRSFSLAQSGPRPVGHCSGAAAAPPTVRATLRFRPPKPPQVGPATASIHVGRGLDRVARIGAGVCRNLSSGVGLMGLATRLRKERGPAGPAPSPAGGAIIFAICFATLASGRS